MPFNEHYREPFGPHGWAWIAVALGVKYYITNKIALRMEIGSIGLLVVGFDFTI